MNTVCYPRAAEDSPSVASLRLDDQLCFALYAASNVITRAYRAPLAKLGLTYPQYLAMLVLWEHGEQTIKSLAEKLDLDSSTVTPLVQRLVVAGLVHSARDPSNQRLLCIQVTSAGRSMQKRAALIQERVACQTHLRPDEFVALRAQLHKLVVEINKTAA